MEETKNNKKIWLIVVILLVLAILAAVYFLFLKNRDNSTGNTNQNANQEEAVRPSVAIGAFSLGTTFSSRRAVQDKDGLIYYAINGDTKKAVMVKGADNKLCERYSWEPQTQDDMAQNIEIVGVDGDKIYYIFSENTSGNCALITSSDNIYYYLSLGTASYSGSGQMSLDESSALISQLKEKCVE